MRQENQQRLRRICIAVLLGYLLIAVLFYVVGGEQLQYKIWLTEGVTPSEPVGELLVGTELAQPFTADGNELTAVQLQISTYARKNTCHLKLEIESAGGKSIGTTTISAEELEDNSICRISFEQPVQVIKGERYLLRLTSPDGTAGNAVTVWWGNTMPAARYDVAVAIPTEDQLQRNGQPVEGMLQFQLEEKESFWFGHAYWYLVAACGAVLVFYSIWTCRMEKRGRMTLLLRAMLMWERYGYLMKQLVQRDFKTKYKRSVLGMCWSFLNPLLTMLVQYVVFSTLFKSDIPNFALYLLTGIVCFNFFTESTTMALQSIVGNASLITKVYVPKYIYPVSRVLSLSINLVLSLIPLAVVMIFTGTAFRPAILLLPFGLGCLLIFSLAMGFLLSTAMVFFRDTQFLWGVVSMMWNYLTPIFYPESIIPSGLMPLYKCNPMYHIVRFIRTILISGVSPEPKAYLYCLLVTLLPLAIGILVFKKNQDKFILHL